MLNKIIGFFSAAALALVLVTSVDAAVLKNAWLRMGDSTSGTTTTHTFRFYVPSATFNSVQFLYCTAASGTPCSTPDMDASSATIDPANFTRATVDVSGDWTESAITGRIRASKDAADGTGQADFVMGFTSVVNPDFDSLCTEASGGSSTETCYVRVTTYPNTDFTGSGDSAVVSMTITRSVVVSATVDPSFSLIIAGVDPTTTATANSTTLTTGITPSVTTVPFGNLQPATPKFIAQSATVTTNATNGYSITVRMGANMVGNAYGDDIDPYTATGNDASTTQAQTWTTPDGTTSGTDTGWLGVGTNDSDVTGYVSNAFFSLSSAGSTTVALETTSASAETNIFIYGIEVNAYQEADSYTGTMRYNALPVY